MIHFVSAPFSANAIAPARHSQFSQRSAQGRYLYLLPAGEHRQSRHSRSLAWKMPLISASRAHRRISSAVTGRGSLELVAPGSHPRLQGIPSAYSLHTGRPPQLGTVPPSSFWSSPGFYKPEGDGDQKL